MEKTDEVPKIIEDHENKQVTNTRSLGLHDLYKAAFSQETDREFEAELEPQIQDSTNYNGEIKKEDYFQSYMYSFKNMPVCIEMTKSEDYSNKTVKDIQISFEQPAEYIDTGFTFKDENVFSENSRTVILHRPYGNYDTNSVLDLDKGIPIPVHVVKTDQEYEDYSNRNYQGDAQILQRYLNDSAFHKDLERDEVSSTSQNDECLSHFLLRKEDKKEEAVGVNPETFGLKYEDCDFNSSDSFASTESIIPKNIHCPKCPKKFMFKSDLLKHDKHKHTLKQRMMCKYCNREFASQQNLIFHEKSHNKKKINKCEMCKKTFKKPGFLVKHLVKKHSKSNLLNCEECSKVFTTPLLLKNHFRKCHGCEEEKPFKCQFCAKTFERKQSLVVHEKAHLEVLPHVCNICGKSFIKQHFLTNHMKSHSVSSVDNTFTCKFCSKNFKTEQLLDEHKRKHTGEKPFKCNVCMKSFAHKSYLKIHTRKHSSVKPYPCHMCDKKFVTSTDLNKHFRSHTQERPYSCTNCNQRFAQQSNLITHWKKQRCVLKVQEEGTQTNDFELEAIDDKIIATNCVNMGSYNQNSSVNIVVDQSFTSQQPILLTAIGGFANGSSIPMIISSNQNVSQTVTTLPS